MTVVRRVMQRRPLPHVPRIQDYRNVCWLPEIYWLTVDVMGDIEQLLLQYLVLDQLRDYILLPPLPQVVEQIGLALEHEFNAGLAAVFACQMKWSALLLVLRHHVLEAALWALESFAGLQEEREHLWVVLEGSKMQRRLKLVRCRLVVGALLDE